MKNLLPQIHEDMSVYDRTGKKIGEVRNVQFGDEDLEHPGIETATTRSHPELSDNLVDYVAKALTAEEQIPEEIRNRLQRYGYIKIDTGFLASARYASAEQIADVTGDRVDLNITKDELVTN